MPRFLNRFFCKCVIFLFITFLISGCGKNYFFGKIKKLDSKKKLSHTYTVSLKEDPPFFDPVNTLPEKANLLSQQLEGLVKYDFQTMKAKPALAVGWKSDLSFKEWTFKLRRDVYFSNGEAFKAYVVKKCWERACKEGGDNQSVKEVFSNLRGYDELVAGKTAELSGIEIVDDFTLKVSLKNPDSSFPQKLGVPVAFVYSFSEWERDPQSFYKKPVGSGPFVVANWETGKQLILKRNDYYWGKKPALKKVVFLIHRTPETALQAFQSGVVQEVFVYPELYSRLKSSQTLAKRFKSAPLLAINYLMFNLAHCRKFSRGERERLFSLVDPEQVVATMEPEGVDFADSLIPFSFFGFKFEKGKISRAFISSERKGVKKWHFSSEVILTFPASNEYEILAEKLKDEFQAQGVTVKTQMLDWPLFFEALNKKELVLFSFPWIADYPDVEAFLKPLFHSKGEANFSFFNFLKFDVLIESSAKLRGKKRMAVLQEAVKLIENEQVAKPLFYYLSRWLVSEKVGNFQANGYGWINYSAIKLIE